MPTALPTATKGSNTIVADAYLRFLFTPAGQEIIARHHYRPRDPAVAAKYAGLFPHMRLLTIDDDFGGWAAARKRFFADRGIFDRMSSKRFKN